MKGEHVMKLFALVLVALSLGACCVFGGELVDGPELDLKASARWAGELPPAGSVASVDFYQLVEGDPTWQPVELGVAYPEDGAGSLVDTFRFPWAVPETGEKVTYRYELVLQVAGVVYSPAEYPDALTCESGEWWWYFAGRLYCSEEER